MPEFGNESGLGFLHCCFSCLLEVLITRFTTGFCILEVYELRRSWWWRWWSWCSGCCWLFACHKHDPWVCEQASSPLHPNWTNFAAHNAKNVDYRWTRWICWFLLTFLAAMLPYVLFVLFSCVYFLLDTMDLSILFPNYNCTFLSMIVL